MGKGLTRALIIETAAQMASRRRPGDVVSISDIARELDVKPASLYNHIESADALRVEVGLYAAEKLCGGLESAIAGKEREEALMALALAYRSFERENPGLYFSVMILPSERDPRLQEAARKTIDPILRILSGYRLSEELRNHWQRVLRAAMHGFISQERFGYFNTLPQSVEESFRTAIRCVADGLECAEKRQER